MNIKNLAFCFLAFFQLVVVQSITAQQSTRLTRGWEFVKNDLASPWEAVRPTEKDGSTLVPIWEKVELPHCVNA